MTKDEALKLSMEAMEITGGFDVEINAIKEALMSGTDEVQPQPWEKFCDSNCVWTDHHPDCKLAQRTWVGLTDEDIKPFCDANHIIFGAYTIDFVRAIEAKLKEKNTHD